MPGLDSPLLAPRTALPRIGPALHARTVETVERARLGLLAGQKADGHWVGELQGDTILESEYILLMAFLGRETDPRIHQAANYLKQQQLPDGGWTTYTGGPADLTVSVKAYFALKIAGESSEAPAMQRAARVIRDLGGAENSNSFTRFYLALLGQFPYDSCPTVPPELILLPRWFPMHIYALSAWSRTIFVPLSIVSALRPVRQLPTSMHIRELFLEPPETLRRPAARTPSWLSWTNCFLTIDGLLKRLERWGLMPLRQRAIRQSLAWMREHTQESDGIGAIFPPMVYHCIVLHALGIPAEHPEMVWAMQQIDDLMITEGDTLRLQPCLSPVWDTALSLVGLAETDQRTDAPEVRRAVHWLLEREIRQAGDWKYTAPRLEPGGWCFEYHNAFYPDTDDTAMVLLALARLGQTTSTEAQPAVHRALQWLVGMQNTDGGWAAFDRNINKQFLEKVPFADHNAMLDPSCPDITARVLEALAEFGYRVGQKPVDRAIRFILEHQEADGSWFGRWGVNYLYGTWQVLVGLERVGYDMTALPVRRSVAWLKQVQQADGGWGETCRSYDEPAWKGEGPSTPSQTAWALMGLLAAGEADAEEVRAGVDYLVRTQQADGSWQEESFTGTGFPKVFYLRYHMYPVYFPLMALGRYLRTQ